MDVCFRLEADISVGHDARFGSQIRKRGGLGPPLPKAHLSELNPRRVVLGRRFSCHSKLDAFRKVRFGGAVGMSKEIPYLVVRIQFPFGSPLSVRALSFPAIKVKSKRARPHCLNARVWSRRKCDQRVGVTGWFIECGSRADTH
jgi:hypothetical protein